jgi:hypothetical protein
MTTPSIDVPTTIFVALTLLSALTACFFGYKFSKAIGGELGASFKWVMVGTLLFALTRVDDMLKVTQVFTQMGVDYTKTVLFPHHITVALSWFLITFGFYKMYKTFSA